MKKRIAILMVLLLSLTLAACSTPTEPDPNGNGDQKDHVFYVTILTGDTTDKFPHLWNNRGAIFQVTTFRSLFLPNAELTEVKPDLASSYEISDDGLTVEVVMKDNLKWSDGQPLTAADVEFSIKTNLKAAVSNGIYTNAFTKIEGASAYKEGSTDSISGLEVDGNKVTFTLTTPVGNFIQVLGQFAIYPKHKLENADPLELHNNDFWKLPVSNGMYKVTEFNSGNYFILELNEHYEGTKPKIEKIQVNFIADAIAAAQSNKLDFYNTNSTDQISELSKLSAYKATPVDILFYRYLIPNIKDATGKVNPTVNDVRVREAIIRAIDRKAIAESLYPSLAALSNAGVPLDHSAYNSSIDGYAYDPVKAKALLEEAGFDFSKTLKLRMYHTDQTSIDFMDAVAYYLGEVGITVDLAVFQGDATSELFQVRDYDFALKNLSAFGFEEWYGEYASTNANFRNILGGETAFDELRERLNASTEAAERAGILKELQVLEQELLYKLPLLQLKNVIFINNDRISVPSSVKFGNPWYNHDIQFEAWSFK